METTARQNLFTRDDTFLGICQGLGEDLSVSPDLFRVAMIPALFFYPVQTLIAYFGAGVIVLATRMIFPVQGRKRKAGKAAPAVASDRADISEQIDPVLDLAA